MSTKLLLLYAIHSLFIIDVVLCQTCLNNPPSITHDATGNDIEWEQLSANTFATTLVFDVSTKIWNDLNAQITTRLHNDLLPSPTLRFQRGKQYQITLINNLGPESPNNPTAHNVPKDPNTTNLHTHGLHIGGMFPGDDVHFGIKPGEQHTYIYNIPCDHSGGTFWYHPHHHGSTNTQVSQGAAGALIIEDDAIAENLPSWYTDMKEQIFFVTHMNFNQITANVDPTFDDVWSYTTPNRGPSDTIEPYFVNGQYKPTICMTAGEWIKFRFAQVEASQPNTYHIGNGECTVYLLARDGVIVHGLDNNDVPRAVDSVVWLAQPSRADVAIFCPGNPSGSASYDIWLDNDGEVNVIATIEVTGTTTTPSIELTPFVPTRPSYLENLLDGYYKGNLPTTMYERREGPRGVFQDYWENLEVTGSSIAGQEFISETDYLEEIEINTINNWEIQNGGSSLHPFHIHVNHFQILESGLPQVAADPANQKYYPPAGYQAIGDFHDTIWGPGMIRFKTDIWAGTVTMHCHILEHEDQGAMATINIINGCDNSYNDYAGAGDCDYIDTCDQFTSSPTAFPTPCPTVPTMRPTESPTVDPTDMPTMIPTPLPSQSPTSDPTIEPTFVPSGMPSDIPSSLPTHFPSAFPTEFPSQSPSTKEPTYDPTVYPSVYPSEMPTIGAVVSTKAYNEDCETKWTMEVAMNVVFKKDPVENKDIVQSACREAFCYALLGWSNSFCYDLSLLINPLQNARRRLLQSNIYEIIATYSYNDNLQIIVFDNYFNKDTFASNFREEFCRLMVEENLVDAADCSQDLDGVITVSDPIENQNNNLNDSEERDSNNDEVVDVVLLDPSTYTISYWLMFGGLLLFVVLLFLLSVYCLKKENKPTPILEKEESKSPSLIPNNKEKQTLFGAPLGSPSISRAFEESILKVGLTKMNSPSNVVHHIAVNKEVATNASTQLNMGEINALLEYQEEHGGSIDL